MKTEEIATQIIETITNHMTAKGKPSGQETVGETLESHRKKRTDTHIYKNKLGAQKAGPAIRTPVGKHSKS